MKTVWKFPLLSTGPAWVNLPFGSEIVHVGRDPATGLISIWAEVDPAQSHMTLVFQIIATGETIPPGFRHRGTVIIESFVWHLYEKDPA